jgi:hypothetical protein
MKWFKHDSDARHDAKLQKLRLKYGLEGYGMYFFLLECIVGNIESHNLTFELEEDSELISAATNIHVERVEEMMRYMVNLGLFEETAGKVTCLKIAKRLDGSMTSNPKFRQLIKNSHDAVMMQSGLSHDGVMINPDLVMLEEKRREEKRRDEKRRDEKKASSKKFVPPTLAEVKAHFQEKGFGADPERFFNYYDSADWVKANNEPVVYWKRAAANWEAREKDHKSTTKNVVSIDPITGREAHYTTMQPREDGSW